MKCRKQWEEKEAEIGTAVMSSQRKLKDIMELCLKGVKSHKGGKSVRSKY